MLLSYQAAFANAFMLTSLLTLLSILFGTILGVFVGTVSAFQSPIRIVARVYIEILLGLPVLVFIVWAYYVLPSISSSFTLSPFWTAVLVFSMSLSAFIGEIVEAGIRSIPKQQLEAAHMLGISRLSAILSILLPQALTVMWPAMVTQYITTYKFSTLASVIGVNEVLHTGSLIIHETYRPLEVYTAIGLIFIATVYPLNLWARRLGSKAKQRGLLAGI